MDLKQTASTEIGGRKFTHITDSTLQHDIYMREKLLAAGTRELHIAEGESADSFAKRTLTSLSTNMAIFDVLGGLLLPAEYKSTEWTPRIAAETSEFLKELTEPEDKKIVRGLIAGLVEGFLRAELTLLRLIPNSSVRAVVAANMLVSPRTAPPRTGANGHRSSARSRKATSKRRK